MRAAAHPAETRKALRLSRSPALEDHEHAELLVTCELVLRTGFDEHGMAFVDRDGRPLDVERAAALEDDVDLVDVVWVLVVRLGGDERVAGDLDAGAVVQDLVAAGGTSEGAL